MLSAGKDTPLGQGAHVVAPVAEYLQATHLVHAVELAAAANLTQSAQVEATVAPTAAENLQVSQSEQVSTVVAPTAAEYVPAVQLVQAEAPGNHHVRAGGAQ